MEQACSLSIRDDGQDARPTGNLGFLGAEDCFASLAMTIFHRTLLRDYDGELDNDAHHLVV